MGYITKRMDSVVASDLKERFSHLYCKSDFRYLLSVWKNSKKEQAPKGLMRELVFMFRDVGVECEYGESFSYYKALYDSLTIPESREDITEEIVRTLASTYQFFPTAEEFMQRIVDSLEIGSGVLGESLRLRILKQFLRTVNVRSNERYYSARLGKQSLDSLDESVFDELNVSVKNETPKRRLLRACTNLAQGTFISPTTTKEYLFLFAFAYGMRYYFDTDGKDYNAALDMEKNLFRDYYCDNLARFIQGSSEKENGSSDTEPVGLGLNPKNFADVLFVAYLNREDLSPSERAGGFFEAVARVKDAWVAENELDEAQSVFFEDVATGDYREMMRRAVSLRGAELEAFILKNYYCETRYEYRNASTGAVAQGRRGTFEQSKVLTRSAYRQYCTVLSQIKDALGISEDVDFGELDGRSVKDSKNDAVLSAIYERGTSSATIMRVSELEYSVPELDHEQIRELTAGMTDPEKLLNVIGEVKRRLDPYSVLSVKDASKMTRTKMIAAYYHLFCLENDSTLDADADESRWSSFGDLYETLRGALNEMLIFSGYQPLSAKNLFDVLVVFFAYCQVNGLLT